MKALRKLASWLMRDRQRVLELLSDGRWWTGLDLVNASDGRLKRGTVYVLLGELERRCVIVSRELAPELGLGEIRRREYRLAAVDGR